MVAGSQGVEEEMSRVYVASAAGTLFISVKLVVHGDQVGDWSARISSCHKKMTIRNGQKGTSSYTLLHNFGGDLQTVIVAL